jgi:phosphoglycerate dehydrogenase-like enzyme
MSAGAPGAPGTSDTVVVGIFYPTEWYGDPDGFTREVAALADMDPRVEVVVEAYDEPHSLRSARGKPHDESLRAQAPELTDAQRQAFGRAEVAIAIDLPFDVATVAPNLRWVQAVGAGTGQLQSAGLAAAGIRLTTSAGSNAVAIAEFALGRLIQDVKRFREIEALQTKHVWDPLYGTQLAGTTLGLVGLGAINGAVARRAQAMDMRVLATRRSATPGATAPDVDVLYPTTELHAMLGECDAVIAAVPETPETEGLIDERALASMKPGTFFCNVGRGSLVDERALIAALRTGHLRAAALDVASEEPLPPEHPLWDAPNLLLSYHCSSSPGALFANLHRLVRENLRRYLDGEPLNNEVDLHRGY